MDWPLICALVALVIAVAALARCYVPPQSRKVAQLIESVDVLAEHVQVMDQRLIARAGRENMAKAREVYETKKQRQARIEEEALQIIAAKGAAPAQANDPEAQRTALRAQFLRAPPGGGGKPS